MHSKVSRRRHENMTSNYSQMFWKMCFCVDYILSMYWNHIKRKIAKMVTFFHLLAQLFPTTKIWLPIAKSTKRNRSSVFQQFMNCFKLLPVSLRAVQVNISRTSPSPMWFGVTMSSILPSLTLQVYFVVLFPIINICLLTQTWEHV
jgi:hypothetical protein